jgi:hypothetical protein
MRHKGGKKRTWKYKGKQPTRKQYQEYCHSQMRQGLVPDGWGKWIPIDSLSSNKIKEVYRAQFGC